MLTGDRSKFLYPRIFAFGVLTLASTLVKYALASPASSEPSQSTSAAKLQADIPKLMKEGDVPGLSIALVGGGKVSWQHNFGVKNEKTGQPVDDNTIFEAASLSKPVFAYAVLKLVEQGKLRLDVPLTIYLPKPYIEGDPRLAKITARFVLSHRTGFPNWRGDGNPLTIHFTPGERFSYSGEGYVYLQRVVEQIEGKPLNDVMNELVFTPLGMTSSSYVWRTDFDDRTATGHDSDATPQDLWKPKEAGAASTLNTSAHDYALFLTAILNRVGLKKPTFREMETPEIAVDPQCTNCTERVPKELSKNVFWGLGWGIEKGAGETWLWHWGDNGSFKCFVVANPNRRSAVVLFTNSENGLAIAPAIIRDVFGSKPLAFAWLKYDAYDSLAMHFRKAVREQGLDMALQNFLTQLKDSSISERSVNSIAYQLLWQKHTADAIRLFQLNTEFHPQSANAYDSLGEAYMESGDKTHAIQNYEKSLSLDPQNNNAASRLKKLREPSP